MDDNAIEAAVHFYSDVLRKANLTDKDQDCIGRFFHDSLNRRSYVQSVGGDYTNLDDATLNRVFLYVISRYAAERDFARIPGDYLPAKLLK
jgi:hypothetical protein